MRNISPTVCAGLALIMASGSSALADASLNLVGHWDSGVGEGTEVISVQSESARAAVTNSAEGTVTILDLSVPATPTAVSIVRLGLGPDEGVTSVAFHPEEDYFIVVIEADGTTRNGRIEIREADDGELLRVLPAGSEPDAVAFDRFGRYAVVANEAESFSFDAVTREFDSPDGSVTVVDLREGPENATATLVPLTSADGVPGFVNFTDPARALDERFLERGVDLNGDGQIADEFEDGVGGFDEDGNRIIEDRKFLAGYIDGHEVWGNEEAGELVMIPLLDNSPRFLEPELSAFSRDGRYAYVVMQENNGVAVIDVVARTLLGYFGLGTTTHDADIWEDGVVVFERDALFALREPDGIAMSPDGRFFVTADEGDTDPKASKTPAGLPTAGGRTISVFDAQTGNLLGDTGNQIDAAAFLAGVYPDGRSDSKGSEPENLVTFRYFGVPYAAVGLERADSVALVSLADPANPLVEDVALVNPGTALGSQAPEGIAFLDRNGSLFVYAANEGSGVVSVFEVMPPQTQMANGRWRNGGRGPRR